MVLIGRCFRGREGGGFESDAANSAVIYALDDKQRSVVLYGFAGQVDGLVRRILRELGPGPVSVLGTGGLAPLMVEESETVTTYVPDLTLLGLRLAYLRNHGGSRPDGPPRRSGAVH